MFGVSTSVMTAAVIDVVKYNLSVQQQNDKPGS